MRTAFEFPLYWRRLIYLRDLLRELVVREMKLRYERSILGMAWAVLNPLAHLLVFTLLRRALGLNIANYPLFVFTGIVTWNWFREGLMLASVAITGNRELIKRPGFPPAILPVISATTPLVDLLVVLPFLLLFAVLGGGRLTGALLALPLVITLQFLLILGLGYVLATFHVTFRDVRHLLTVVLRLLFYLTPIFYDASLIPARYQTVYNLNPMVHLVAAYRMILIQGSLPDLRPLLIMAALVGGLLWLGQTIFTRASYRFVEEL